MAGRFKSFIEDLNEQERRAAEERAIENANRQRIAAEFPERWRALLRNLKDTVTGCEMKGSPFEWVDDADGLNVSKVGMQWIRIEENGIPVVELLLGGPVGVRSIMVDQGKTLPAERHLLAPVISSEDFRWKLGLHGKAMSSEEYNDEEAADEMAMLLAQYADEYEKLKAKFDPFAGI